MGVGRACASMVGATAQRWQQARPSRARYKVNRSCCHPGYHFWYMYIQRVKEEKGKTKERMRRGRRRGGDCKESGRRERKGDRMTDTDMYINTYYTSNTVY
jgi:hypothetical protein